MEKKIYHRNGKLKKAGATIFTSEKLHFKTKTIMRHRKGYFIKIKGFLIRKIYNPKCLCV